MSDREPSGATRPRMAQLRPATSRTSGDFTQELPRKLLATRAKETQSHLCEKRCFSRLSLWRVGCCVDSERAHNPKVAGSNPAPATIQVVKIKGADSIGPFDSLDATMKVFDRRPGNHSSTD